MIKVGIIGANGYLGVELIRILSDQMLQKKRLGVHIFTRGMKGGIRSINTPIYDI